MKTSVVLIDDHVSVREMLAQILVGEGSYSVLGEAATGFEALKICRKHRPRLIVLELIIPELSGVELIRALRDEMSEARVLVYSRAQNRQLIVEALRARPHGFVHKSDALATFSEALGAVTRGCSYFTPFATRMLDSVRADVEAEPVLSGRERAVLQMIAEGLSSKEMADRLEIAPKTVEHHRSHLMEKLGVHHVAGLTRYAMRLGIVGAES
jgi:DNA-binding NarL/FixJ family response regulator